MAESTKIPKLAVKQAKTAEIQPTDRNLKTYTEDEIAAHVAHYQHFGNLEPLRVWKGQILDGDAWYAAAERLQLQTVPVIDLSHFSEEDARAYAMAIKRLAEAGEWDWAAVKSEWDWLKDTEFPDLDLTGFDSDERQKIRAKVAHDELGQTGGQEGEDDQPEVTKYPVTMVGDVWQLGPHRLACGNSFDPEHMTTLIEGDQVHLVATDPPYAVYGSATGIASDIADDKMVRPFFDSILKLAESVLPWFGHCYMFTDWRTYPAIYESIRTTPHMEPKNCIVWDKGGAGLGSNYANTHEWIAFCSKLPPQKAMGTRASGQRSIHKPNVMRHNRVSGKEREHNAAKPVALMRDLIENSSGPGDVVLEPFCGSGTTLIAANQTERICLASEMEPKWCDVTILRFERLSGETATHAATGKTFAEMEAERQNQHNSTD